MKKLLPISLILVALFAAVSVSAQKPLKKTKASMTLQLTVDGGTNGSAVTWDPQAKKYYTLVAGNAEFPIECFNESGKSLGGDAAGEDMRGLWFYPETGEIEGNGYGDYGYFVIVRDASMVPTGKAEDINGASGMNQPEEQSVGTYDPVKKCVAFYSQGAIVLYERATFREHQTINIDSKIMVEDINTTSMGYTGKSGYEYALLDYTNNKVLLLDRKGVKKGAVALPKGSGADASFWFSVANGYAWLFNTSTRVWTGYKLFK